VPSGVGAGATDDSPGTTLLVPDRLLRIETNPQRAVVTGDCAIHETDL
jgi:hypothetical protein